MPDNESMEKLAAALELPVAYFHAASEPMAEAILVMSQLAEIEQEELVRKMRDFVQEGLHSSGAQSEPNSNRTPARGQ